MNETETTLKESASQGVIVAELDSVNQGWASLDGRSIVALILLIGTLAAVCIPKLPPGVGFSDTGELQLASATLGIMHPPGYAVYSSIGFLLTRIPGVDPAYVISLACLASGLAALALCLLIQVRLSVHPWLACALCFALAAHKRTWTNLIVAEVYAPSLALLLGSCYFLLKFVAHGNKRTLYISALLYGTTLAGRPTVIWFLPFILAAWWIGQKRLAPAKRVEAAMAQQRSKVKKQRFKDWGVRLSTFDFRHLTFGIDRGFRAASPPASRKTTQTFLMLIALASLPGIYSVSYYWILDRPETKYNYIEIRNAESHNHPAASDGWGVKSARIVDHVTARQFRRYLSRNWRDARMRLRWLFHEFFLSEWITYPRVSCALVLVLLAVGGALTYQRSAAAALIFSGMILANIGFICTYRIYGMAGDLSLLMTGSTVLLGVLLSIFAPARTGRLLPSRDGIVGLLMLGMCIFTVMQAHHRSIGTDTDATGYLRDIDLDTLPQNVVICSLWELSGPLWYAQWVLSYRPDIEIINSSSRQWLDRVADIDDRTILLTARLGHTPGYRVTPYRTVTHDGIDRTVLWKIERVD